MSAKNKRISHFDLHGFCKVVFSKVPITSALSFPQSKMEQNEFQFRVKIHFMQLLNSYTGMKLWLSVYIAEFSL